MLKLTGKKILTNYAKIFCLSRPIAKHFESGPDLDPIFCQGYQQMTKVAASKERVNVGRQDKL